MLIFTYKVLEPAIMAICYWPPVWKIRPTIAEHNAADLLEVMIFVYQSGYCSLCRRKAYEAMHQIGLVPDWIEAEFPFDCCQLESDV